MGLESDLKSVKCFRLAAKAPIKNFYIAIVALEGCQKKMEAKSRVRLPLDPDTAHMLIRIALQENVHHCFVGIRQAAIYALKYYLTARFEEVRGLELRQIVSKGASLEVTILKGKKNQKKRPRDVLFILFLLLQRDKPVQSTLSINTWTTVSALGTTVRMSMFSLW